MVERKMGAFSMGSPTGRNPLPTFCDSKSHRPPLMASEISARRSRSATLRGFCVEMEKEAVKVVEQDEELGLVGLLEGS